MFDQDTGLTRRDMLLAGAGFATLAGFSPLASSASSSPVAVDFTDPVQALRAHVKLVGSLKTEKVVSFLRLNIYADSGEGNFVPLFTLNNLLIDYWEPQGNDEYQLTKYEAGFYTELDSYQPIESFVNPFTQERLPVQRFRLGPVPRRYTPERFYVMAYNPNPLPLEVIGDRVFLATQSIESFPPREASGNTLFINSFMTYSAKLADMQDPTIASAPVHAQLQNKTEWAPWMGMGERPGGTVARGYGTKVKGLDALPTGVLDNFRKYIPEILDTDNWKEFVSEADG